MRFVRCRLFLAHNARSAVTLIELLIAIVIMLALAAATIPIVAPAMRNREIREAARLVEVFLNGAKNRAMQTGRPVGVVFEQNIPSGSTVLSYAEVPQPYTGDYAGSTINITNDGATVLNAGLNIFNQGDSGWVGLLRPGDLIQFNNRSTLYRVYLGEPYVDLDGNGAFTPAFDPFIDTNGNTIYDAPPAGMLTADGYISLPSASTILYTDPTSGRNYGVWTYTFADQALAMQYMSWYSGGVYNPPAYTSFGQQGEASFAIIRQPVPQSAGKLELPASAAIDLGTTIGTAVNNAVPIPGSGYDAPPPPPTLPTPAPGIGASFRPYPLSPVSSATLSPPPYTSNIIVAFSPNGLVDLVYSWDEPTFTYNGSTIGWQGWQAISTIYFLVGKRELVGGNPTLLPLVEGGQAPLAPCFNLQDPTNVWIAINPQTGLIVSAPSAAVNLTVAPPLGTNQSAALAFWWGQTYQARSLARQAIGAGGR